MYWLLRYWLRYRMNAVDAVEAELATQLEMLPRAKIAGTALNGRGAAVVVDSIDEALKVAEEFAPEHLCMGFAGAEGLLDKARNAGGIFIGEQSGEVMADYVAGPSHVMPTGVDRLVSHRRCRRETS